MHLHQDADPAVFLQKFKKRAVVFTTVVKGKSAVKLQGREDFVRKRSQRAETEYKNMRREDTAMAEIFTGTTPEGLIVENGVVRDGKSCEGEIRIPDGCTEIAGQAFYQNKKLTGLYIPDGVKVLGKYTVNGCVNLEYVRVPESVEKMGDGALVKKIDSNFGFTHVVETKEYYPDIRCKEGCWVDRAFQEMKQKDGWKDSHSMEHIVRFCYEE